MEKMNQVSVTEFMSKSKEEMYDMTVEMVEKYNRLVDICNDSAERMADLMERHSVYTSALKNDIASKDAKIEKLEKEIEGRKKAFNDLREEMANRYIAIETHNDICKTYENDIEKLKKERDKYMARVNDLRMELDCVKASKEKHEEAAHDKVVEDLRESFNYWRTKCLATQEELEGRKEEVKKLNKCIMEKNETINTANDAIVNLRSEIGAHEEENKKLEKRIEELKETMMVEEYNSTARINRLTSEIEKLKVDLIHEREKNEKLAKSIAVLENDMRYTTIIEYQDIIDSLNKDIESWKHDVYEELKKNEELNENVTQYKELVDGLNKDNKYWRTAFATRAADLAEVRKLNDELVDTLDKSSDRVEELEEKIKNLVQEIDYYKNQERIRTDQLRATESKVEELWKEIEKFTKGETKDHGRAGFEEYIKYIIAEEEGKFKAELNKRFSEEVSKISQERTEEELAKVKGVGSIPCGEDAIE